MPLRLPQAKILKFSFLIALFWTLGLTIELFLTLKGKSFCEASSCLVVGELARLRHREMVILGLAYFLGLLILLAFWRPERDLFRKGLVLWVGGGFFAELVFLMRQALEYKLFCPFCLVVGAGVLLSGVAIFYFFKSSLSILLGALGGLFLGFYLTVNPLTPLKEQAFPAFPERPQVPDLILIYSPDCPHCHEVLDFCQKLPKANLNLCPKDKALGVFRILGLSGVPVLIVDRPPRWEILEGSGPIMAYLKERFGAQALPETPENLNGLFIPETGGICSDLQPEKCQ